MELIDKEEENLVKKAEHEMKELNWKCRINELERQTKEILNWKNQTGAKSQSDDSKGKQSKRMVPSKDNTDRRAPATVTGATKRNQESAPTSEDKGGATGRRPLSDQGARIEAPTGNKRPSLQEKFMKVIKPSKSAWNK